MITSFQADDAGTDTEQRRLAELRRLAVLDTQPEPVFDAITRAAAEVCGVPIALVSLIDVERQWFKSNVGLEGVTQTPRDVAFCDHAIRDDSLMEIADARLDARFAGNPLVTGDPNIRFYAGAPIVMDGGERIGTVCVIDRVPRQLSHAQRRTLEGLGRIASACLADRRQRVTASAALAASELRYRAIVEDQTEMISLAQRDGTLTFVNAAYARHFGLTPPQMIGRNLIEFVAAPDRADVLAHLESVCVQGVPASGVNRMLSAEGQTRWVAWSNRPLAEADGHFGSIHSVGRDVTEQQLAERALHATEQQLRTLYEATPAILHSIDMTGRLVHVSDLWLRLLDYTRDEVIGRASADFLAPESRQRARDVVLPEFFRSGRCERVEYQFVSKDGRHIEVLLSAILERDAESQPLRSLAVLEDVTERRRLAVELDRTSARLNAIVDNVPAMLGYWDQDGVNRFANREYQSAVGVPLERIVGRPMREVYESIDPAGYTTVAPHIEQVLQGRRQVIEHAMLTVSGLRQVHTTFVPDRRANGEVAGFYGLAYDITGRKALELRLRESEQHYRSLFDNMTSAFALAEVVVDASGQPVNYTFLAMNAACGGMIGIDPAEAIGRRVTEVLPGIEHDPGDWIGRLGRVAQSGEAAHFEQRAEPLGRWYDVVAYRAAPGQFALIAIDVTDRRQADARLAQSEERLRLMIDAVQEYSMYLLDPQGQVETWNAGAQRIKGYTADEIIGQHYRCFFDAADAARGEPERQLALASELGHMSNEGWRRRKNGTQFWAAVQVTAIRDPAGQLRGFAKVTRDLSERKRQQDLLERVTELSPGAMLLIGADGQIVFANAQTAEMFGYPRAELIGQPHDLLLPERLRAMHRPLREAFMATPSSRQMGAGRELKARRKDGTEFDVEIGLSSFETQDGPAALAAIVDVTERQRQRQRLENALTDKETLLKEVYHRVKNNLQVVQSLLSLQRRSVSDGPARAALEDSVQRVRAMALVHEKLYQAGNLAAVSLPEYTADLLKQLGEATGAAARHVRLTADIAALETGLDNAIPFGLLVTELVTNCMKHAFVGRPAGEVRVSLAGPPGAVQLSVTDNGVGVPPGFELAHTASMGLQLATSLALQLGGELSQRNDGGAAFSAVLSRL